MTSSKNAITRMRGEEWIRGLEKLCTSSLSSKMKMVEIGSFAGESTEVFARHVSQVFAIDPWHASYQEDVLLGCADGPVRDYIRAAGLTPMSEIETLFDSRTSQATNVQKIKAFDHDALDLFDDESVDFLYIDSIHTYEHVKATILRWIGKLRPGGIIGGHDYCTRNWEGVVRAVDEIFGSPDTVFEDTSWIVREARSRFGADGMPQG